MTNWVINRLVLTGPADEISRFTSTCIKLQEGEDDPVIGFDFSALVPMPPEVMATLSNDLTPAQEADTMAATGFKSRHGWRLYHWGTRWNSACHRVVAQSADCYDFQFATASSSPIPVVEALARSFPALTGIIFAIDEFGEASAAGVLANGVFRVWMPQVSPELHFLINEALEDDLLAQVTSRSMAEASRQFETSSASSDPLRGHAGRLLSQVWELVCQKMPASFPSYFQLCHDIQGRLRWQWGLVDGEWEDEDEAAQQLTILVRNPANRDYLAHCCDFSSEPDCLLMKALSDHLLKVCTKGWSPETSEVYWNRTMAAVADRLDEDALRAWALQAILRSKANVAMQSYLDLQLSFVAAAHKVLEGVEAYLTAQVAGHGHTSRHGNAGDAMHDDVEPDIDHGAVNRYLFAVLVSAAPEIIQTAHDAALPSLRLLKSLGQGGCGE